MGVGAGTSTTSAWPWLSIRSHFRVRGSWEWNFFTRLVRSCSENLGILILEPPFSPFGRSSAGSSSWSVFSDLSTPLMVASLPTLTLTRNSFLINNVIAPLQSSLQQAPRWKRRLLCQTGVQSALSCDTAAPELVGEQLLGLPHEHVVRLEPAPHVGQGRRSLLPQLPRLHSLSPADVQFSGVRLACAINDMTARTNYALPDGKHKFVTKTAGESANVAQACAHVTGSKG